VKDELERAIPVLKKHYLTYGEVAGKSVDFVFFDLFKEYKELKAETLASSVFINNGKGGFVRQDLPAALQMAPVMSFTSGMQDGRKVFVAGGNFYGTIPYEGRYDALQPTAFEFDNTTKRFGITYIFPGKNSEVRDMKWIRRSDGGKQLIIARNSDKLQFMNQLPATQGTASAGKQLK
jgi:hypothetical protein